MTGHQRSDARKAQAERAAQDGAGDLAAELFLSTERGTLDAFADLASLILASDWLAATLAEARTEALREAADDWPEDGMTRAEAQRFLADRAARIARSS